MSRGRDRRGDAGLTLFELVVAMAIFALVAAMGMQAVTGMLRLRDRLDARAEATAELARTLSLLRADLGAAVPLPFFPPGSAAPEPALAAAGGVLAISVAGQPGLGGDDPVGLARVVWRVESASGRLLRQGWARLDPADAGARLPEVPVMAAVRGLSVRSYTDPAEGWVAGVPLRGGPAGDTPGTSVGTVRGALPLAVELTLDTEAFGAVTLIETLQ